MAFDCKIDCHRQNGLYIDRDEVHNAYFGDLRRYPVLTEEEERNLVDIYKHSENEKEREAAKRKLVEGNLRFVVSVAKKIGTKDCFWDLVSEGNIGLIKAIEKFDSDKNCRIITYALSWVVSAMKKYKITQHKTVTPPNAMKVHNYAKNVSMEFMAKNERMPDSFEIAELVKNKFNFNIRNIEDIELGRMISIEEKFDSSDGRDRIENSAIFTGKTATNNVDEYIGQEHKSKQLEFFLGKLNERERYVVERCYGIGCEQESFETIGLKLNICGERVRQLCAGAVKKMKTYNNKKQ